MFKKIKDLFNKATRGKYTIVRTMTLLGRSHQIDVYRDEYIRLAALELMAAEIKSQELQGAVAELGVYQGEFAKYINQLFPDKKCYLFDTFEGFDESQIKSEITHGNAKYNDDFSGTSVDLVVKKMTNPSNVIIRKGLFPATTEGLENESYCLVSIDCDLYEPILAGLEYFYPRLIPGGAIFVHDYNNSLYEGTKAAVRQFSKENRISIVPLPDSAGTAIITKNH